MATLSPNSAPSVATNAIPPVSSLNLTPPPLPLPLPQTSTPPQPSTTVPPPNPSTQISDQLDANPPDSSPPNAPAPSSSGSDTTPVTASPNPVDSSPPPTPSTSVSSPPPQTPILPPPPTPSTSFSPPPPQTDPPVNSPPNPPLNSPPPPVVTPPTSSPPNPPVNSPPPPPVVTPPTSSPPPPPSSSPPQSSPTPPSSNPPTNPPPTPPSSEPPEISPPPPSLSPPPPTSNSPPTPPSEPPRRSPVKPSSPPASGSETYSPPATTSPVSDIPPTNSLVPTLPGPQTTAQSNPLPSHHSGTSTSSNGSGNKGVGSGGAAAIGVVAAVVVIGIVGFIALWVFKRKKRNAGANDAYVIPASVGSSPRSDVKLVVKTDYPSPPYGGGSTSDLPDRGGGGSGGGFGGSKPWFTYEELSQATDRFSSQNLLGEGGFGCVYKGILADGRVVAVKQLKSGGGQGEREFQAEVEIISRIHHRHLVSLVGYCISDTKRLLVYEYVPNNTLYFHLHGEGRSTMDWATRLKIAVGAARGIAYLHEDCHPRIIHRDIKSSNILIDNNFEARVADFGLARLAMDADTHVSTRVMGTFGYLAPEYATSGKLTEKSDVYSFGVVLLELITGRKPVDESQPLGDESLVEWGRPLLSHALDTGECEGLVDPRLEKNYIESEMFRMIEAAAACVRHSSTKRPRMGQVVRALEGISDSGDLSNGLRVGESQLYDPAQQSAEIRWFRRVAFGGSQEISSDFFNPSNSYSSHSQMSQNPGFSRQSRHDGNFSAGSGASSRPKQHSSAFSHQGSRNLNFPGEDRQRDDLLW